MFETLYSPAELVCALEPLGAERPVDSVGETLPVLDLVLAPVYGSSRLPAHVVDPTQGTAPILPSGLPCSGVARRAPRRTPGDSVRPAWRPGARSLRAGKASPACQGPAPGSGVPPGACAWRPREGQSRPCGRDLAGVGACSGEYQGQPAPLPPARPSSGRLS